MKDLVIIGVGGFGREAYYLAKEIGNWNIKGYLGNYGDDPHRYKIDLPLLGVIEEYQPSENEVFALGIADPKKKEKFVTILASKGADFVSLIHPLARINETAIIGEGCVIGGRTTVGDCSVIGNYVHLAGSMIGQDVVIGDYSTTTGFTNVPTAKIGKRVFLGSHSVILSNVGDDAYVSAGSVVITKVKPGTRVFGNPAKKMDF